MIPYPFNNKDNPFVLYLSIYEFQSCHKKHKIENTEKICPPNTQNHTNPDISCILWAIRLVPFCGYSLTA